MRIIRNIMVAVIVFASAKAYPLSCPNYEDEEVIKRYKNIFIGYVEVAEFRPYYSDEYSGRVLGKIKTIEVLKGNKVPLISTEQFNKPGQGLHGSLRLGEVTVFHTNNKNEMKQGICSPNFWYLIDKEGGQDDRIYHYKKILGIKQTPNLGIEKQLLLRHFAKKMNKESRLYDYILARYLNLPDDLEKLKVIWREKYGKLPHEDATGLDVSK